jgi:hypothetical protein
MTPFCTQSHIDNTMAADRSVSDISASRLQGGNTNFHQGGDRGSSRRTPPGFFSECFGIRPKNTNESRRQAIENIIDYALEVVSSSMTEDDETFDDVVATTCEGIGQ